MFAIALRFLGGHAYSRSDLRLLYGALFLSFLGTSMTFPLRMLYARVHGASPSELGLMASAFMLGPILFQLPMGWLIDRWGRVPVFLIGLIAHPVLAFLYIPLNSPTELIALRFLEGVAVSAFRPALAAYITDVTSEEHRGEAFGALAATLNAGMFIGPLAGGIVAQQYGFTAAFLLNVAVEGLAVPLVLGRIHEPAVHQERSHDEGRASWRRLFSLYLVGGYVALATIQIVFSVMGALWTIWLNDLGGSYTYIGLTFTVFALPQIFFATGAGRMADRFGRTRFVLAAGLIAAGIYASYGFVENLIAILILGVIEGIVLVFLMPVAQAFLADASPVEARGRVQGISGLLSAVGGAAASYASLPLYHVARVIPFAGIGGVMVVGSSLAAITIYLFYRRREGNSEAAEVEATPA